MPGDPAESNSISRSWGLVIAAWVLVSVPLLWGVWQTVKKAAALFR